MGINGAKMVSNEQFNAAVKTLKEADRVNLKAMCRKLGISYSAFNHYKRGGVGVDDETVEKIAGLYPQFRRYLEVAPEDEGQQDITESERLKKEMRDRIEFLENSLTLERSRYDRLSEAYLKLVDKHLLEK